MMDLSNRPYKGVQAEQEERTGLYETPTSYEKKDTVVEAGTNCIIIGLCTFFLGIGFLFFIAAFVLGIYAMATNRMRQGILLAISALALHIIMALVIYFLAMALMFGAMLDALKSVPTAPPFPNGAAPRSTPIR